MMRLIYVKSTFYQEAFRTVAMTEAGQDLDVVEDVWNNCFWSSQEWIQEIQSLLSQTSQGTTLKLQVAFQNGGASQVALNSDAKSTAGSGVVIVDYAWCRNHIKFDSHSWWCTTVFYTVYIINNQ